MNSQQWKITCSSLSKNLLQVSCRIKAVSCVPGVLLIKPVNFDVLNVYSIHLKDKNHDVNIKYQSQALKGYVYVFYLNFEKHAAIENMIKLLQVSDLVGENQIYLPRHRTIFLTLDKLSHFPTVLFKKSALAYVNVV